MLPSGIRPVETITNFAFGQKVYYRRRQRRWQKAPFNLPLDYDSQTGSYVPDVADSLGSPYSNAESLAFAYTTSWYNDARSIEVLNKSYDRLKSKLYDTAALGVDAVEYRQSLSMVASTCGTLIKAALQVKRLDFAGAARSLRMKFIPKGVSKRKSFANNWLEYHFGWEPLMGDIHDACEVLNNPEKTFSAAEGSSSITESGTKLENLGSISRKTDWVMKYRGKNGAMILGIQDRTKHSLDQFGILNPLAIAWELVPFSFVVDWYANVGQLLGSLSDFAGMTLTRSWYSLKLQVFEAGTCYLNPGFTSTQRPRVFSGTGIYARRTLGLWSPQFNVKQLRLPSVTRAATQVSLLIQVLGK